MGNIEHRNRIDQWYRDAEDVLTGHFGEASDEEEYGNVADAIIGDLADAYQGAVDALNTAYRQLSNINPGGGQDRWVREALDTLRTAVRGQ
jgi:hypothetical protein